jgi:hypothetical protein
MADGRADAEPASREDYAELMDANLVPAAAVAVLERDEGDGAMAPMPAAMTEVGDGIVDLASLLDGGESDA